MIGDNIWPVDARNQLLHILPQASYHDSAEIRGSNAALRRLGLALLDASKKGQAQKVTIAMMAADGEGYQVIIQPMSDQQMGRGPLPYAQLGQPWEMMKCAECPNRKSARSQIEEAQQSGADEVDAES